MGQEERKRNGDVSRTQKTPHEQNKQTQNERNKKKNKTCNKKITQEQDKKKDIKIITKKQENKGTITCKNNNE